MYVASSYIIECTNAGALLPLKRSHFLGMSAESRGRFQGTADPLGDRSVWPHCLHCSGTYNLTTLCECSYTEEVLPEEMTKILANCDRAMAALGKKSGAGHVAAVTTAKGRRIATAIGAIDEIYSTFTAYINAIYICMYLHGICIVDTAERERAEEAAVVQDWRAMKGKGYARHHRCALCCVCSTYLYADLYAVLTQVERVGGGAPGCGGAGAPVQRVERALAGRHSAGKP